MYLRGIDDPETIPPVGKDMKDSSVGGLITGQVGRDDIFAVKGSFAIDKTAIWYRFMAIAVWRHVLLEERSCCLMVPVRQDDVAFLVVCVKEGIGRWWIPNDDCAY